MRNRPLDMREIDLGDPRNLNPTAAPVDSYVRPAPVQGPSLDLVKALGSFNGELRQFADSQQAYNESSAKKAKDAKADEDEVNKAIAQYRGMSDPEQRREFVRSNAALNKQYKEHGLQALAGQDAAVEMDREYEQRKANTDPAQWNDSQTRAELYEKYYGQLPDHPAARGGFNRVAGTLNQKNADKADGERLKREEGDRDAGFMQTMRNSLDEVNKAHEGKPPEERARLVRGAIIEKMDLLKNTKGLPRQRAMSLVGGFLDQLAQEPGNGALITDMLDNVDDRGVKLRTLLNGKGEKLEEAAKRTTMSDSEKRQAGQLADFYQRFQNGDDTPEDNKLLEQRIAEERENPQRGASLREASERAKAARLEAKDRDFKKNAETRFLTENGPTLSSLAHSGQLYKVQGDETLTSGDQKVVINRDKMREAGMKAAEAEIIQRGAANKLSPEEVWGQRMRLYEKNGQDHHVAEDLAKHVARVGTGVTGETVPQFLVDNWPLVTSMRKDSPKMFNRLFPAEQRKFFDALDIATEYTKDASGKVDFVQAVRQAQYVMQNGDKMPGIPPAQLKTQVGAIMKRLSSDNPDGWWGGGRGVDSNQGMTPEMQADVEQRLEYFAKRGAQGDTLTKKVAEMMRNDYAVAGGRHVSIKDTGIAPKEAEAVFKRMLDDYKAQNPKTGSEAISVRREGDRWFVTDVAGLPVRGQSGFTAEQLRQSNTAITRKDIADASGENDNKARGYTEGNDGHVYWQDKNRGIWQRRKNNGWLWERGVAPPTPQAPTGVN